jgi:DNA-binding LacI/PurR family transcriptional regulator
LALTIRDLAGIAGVSVGTVSRVLNRHPSVRPALRQRVEKVLRETGFRPNASAQNLARKSSGCIGFLVANRPVLQPFNAWVLNGVTQCCEERGYFVLYEHLSYRSTSPLASADLSRALRTEGAADAVILAGTNYPNMVECLDKIGVFHVLVGNSYFAEAPREHIDQVRFDHLSGGRQATEYLIQLGHRDIWYVGDLSLPWYVERHEGYLRAMQEAGLEPRAQVEGLSDDRFLNGFHSAEMILLQKQPVTAMIGSTNEAAHGIWEAVERQGLQVPNDISLVGFDDERAAPGPRPLTTVSVDPEQQGRELARMAIAKIQAEGAPLPEVVIPAQLVRHGTCRPILPGAGHAG